MPNKKTDIEIIERLIKDVEQSIKYYNEELIDNKELSKQKIEEAKKELNSY